jgi:peptidoglycan/LPS O-acetylase OafA/YrhL
LLAAALACTAIFVLLLQGRLGWLSAAPIAFLGTISYSLYLLHQTIGFSIIHALEAMGVRPAIAIGAAVALSLAGAAVLTFLVERPATHWIRARWRARRASRSVGVTRASDPA